MLCVLWRMEDHGAGAKGAQVLSGASVAGAQSHRVREGD
jgi:hypothetical protein